MFFQRFESRDPNWNLFGGLLAMLGGMAFLVWPQLALALVAGTLGLNCMLLGAHLFQTGWEQKQLGTGPRVEQLHQEPQPVNPWVGASERQRREARRAQQGSGFTGYTQVIRGWF